MASSAEGTPSSYPGLLVDWGGVMTTDVFDTFRVFCEREGLSPEAIGERFRHDPGSRELLIGLETGTLPEEEFEPRFAAILDVAHEGLIDRLFAGGGPDPVMLETVRRARSAGVRTGLISNSWGTRRYDRPLLAELFDGIVLSGEEGMRKPAPEIYSLGAERIALEPNQCVFVDDLPFNLEPARELGMATVHHRRTEDTVAELEQLLAVKLR
jgi:putative hydrolase of the HAD superfamily